MSYVWYNDTHLIPLYIFGMVYFCLVLIAALLVHEAAHGVWFKLKKNKSITFKLGWGYCLAGEEKDYINLTEQEYINVNAWGVTLGILPIVLVSFFNPVALYIIIPYLVAVRQDIGEVITNIKWDDGK